MVPAKYRGITAAVVGGLLLLGLCGATPYKYTPAPNNTLAERAPEVADSALPAVAPNLLTHDIVHSREDDHEYLTVTDSAHSRRERQEERLVFITHVIESGESTWTIAERYRTDVGTLQALNPEVDADLLVPGDAIRVVPGFSGAVHTVAEGDTMESIAAGYSASLDAVLKASRLSLDDTLSIGAEILVPGGRRRAQVASRSDAQRREAPAASYATVAPPKPAAPVPTPAPAPSKQGGWIWPITGGFYFSEYGYREGGFHRGLDVAAPVGTPVIAAAAGTVVASGWDGGYGYCVTIEHGGGLVTRYAHASKLLVEVGQKVGQGERVILVGNTGNSTGPHLHFEVQVDGVTVNPRLYLP